MLKFKFNVTNRGIFNDWSTYRLITLPCLMMLSLASELSYAQPTSTLTRSIPDNNTLKWLVPAIVALFVFTVSQIIIPMINRFNDKRNARKTYLTYLQTSVENSKSHYGEEMSFDFYTRYHAKGVEPDWLIALKEHGGIPMVFAAIEKGIRKYESQDFDFHKEDFDPYVPHLSFTKFSEKPCSLLRGMDS